MNVPSTPGYERSSSACQATAYGTSTSFAPSARMRSSFAAGAVSIATTLHGTPAARAAYATPWPALPALIVHTPRRRSASDSSATALAAPRSLYALIGWRFSSLSRTSGKPGPSSRRTSGVRTIVPAMRFCASRISLNAMGRTGSSTQYQRRGCHVFDRDAHRLEQRKLLGVAPARSDSGHHGSDLRDLTPRRDDIARFAQCGFARVDEDAGGGDEIVVQLAPVGTRCADRIDVRSGSEPASLQDGRRRARRDDNHVRATHRIRRTRHGLHAMSFRKCRRVTGTPHAYFLERSNEAQRGEVTLRLHAGSENPEHRRVRARQQLSRDRRRRSGPHLGDEPAVHHRERLPRLGLEHHDQCVVGVDPDILRIERDELGPEGARVRRHDGEEAVMGGDGEHGAYRLYDLARGQRRERLRDGGNKVRVVQSLLHSRFVEDFHHAQSLACAGGAGTAALPWRASSRLKFATSCCTNVLQRATNLLRSPQEVRATASAARVGI